MTEPTRRPLRAGDSERAAVVDLLRAHHLDGRLTVEEFEERVGAAHRAVTLQELGELHDDLPELAARRGKVVARSRRPPRIPGRLAFVERVELDTTAPVARERLMDFVAPALAANGYKLQIVGDTLQFTRRRRPGWTIVAAIVAFPIGLIALAHTDHDELVVDFEQLPHGRTRMLVHGIASLSVRRAFASLHEA